MRTNLKHGIIIDKIQLNDDRNLKDGKMIIEIKMDSLRQMVSNIGR